MVVALWSRGGIGGKESVYVFLRVDCGEEAGELIQREEPAGGVYRVLDCRRDDDSAVLQDLGKHAFCKGVDGGVEVLQGFEDGGGAPLDIIFFPTAVRGSADFDKAGV